MFGSKTIILYLTPRVLHIATVSDGSPPQIVSTVQKQWNWSMLPSLYSFIKTTVGSNRVRILLPDEYSYVLELSIPATVAPHQERVYIHEQLSRHIPEVLHANDWDYKEITSKGTEKNVLIFAPVKVAYDAIYKAVQESDLPIEAVEPVAIAGKRNNNPILGLAMKKDITGKDEEILNVIPREDTEKSSDEFVPEHERTSPFVWIGLLIALLLMAAGGFLWYRNTTPQQPVPTPEPTITEAPPTETPTPTPTEEPPLDVSTLDVNVLNGTGLPGVSSSVASLLRDKGFETITTGNADSYDYTTTIVRKKEGVSDQIYTILTDILSEYTLEKFDILTSDNPYDVLIIVGEKHE